MSQIVGKKSLSCNAEEIFKKILDPDSGVDDFQSLIASFLSKIHLW